MDDYMRRDGSMMEHNIKQGSEGSLSSVCSKK